MKSFLERALIKQAKFIRANVKKKKNHIPVHAKKEIQSSAAQKYTEKMSVINYKLYTFYQIQI